MLKKQINKENTPLKITDYISNQYNISIAKATGEQENKGEIENTGLIVGGKALAIRKKQVKIPYNLLQELKNKGEHKYENNYTLLNLKPSKLIEAIKNKDIEKSIKKVQLNIALILNDLDTGISKNNLTISKHGILSEYVEQEKLLKLNSTLLKNKLLSILQTTSYSLQSNKLSNISLNDFGIPQHPLRVEVMKIISGETKVPKYSRQEFGNPLNYLEQVFGKYLKKFGADDDYIYSDELKLISESYQNTLYSYVSRNKNILGQVKKYIPSSILKNKKEEELLLRSAKLNKNIDAKNIINQYRFSRKKIQKI